MWLERQLRHRHRPLKALTQHVCQDRRALSVACVGVHSALPAKEPPTGRPASNRPSIQIAGFAFPKPVPEIRSEEHTSELQSLMRISYAVFCLKKKSKQQSSNHQSYQHLTYKNINNQST